MTPLRKNTTNKKTTLSRKRHETTILQTSGICNPVKPGVNTGVFIFAAARGTPSFSTADI
jgi:hypothetical protein